LPPQTRAGEQRKISILSANSYRSNFPRISVPPVSTLKLESSAPAPASTSGAVELVQVDSGHEGQRIDNFLIARVKGMPRSHLYRVLRRGEVRVNKGRVRPSYKLQLGDLVRIPPMRLAEPTAQVRPPQAPLRRLEAAVLFEDERIIVLNKPTGMAVHGGSGLSWGLIEAMRVLRPTAAELELVHRLDRETSGCLLLSKRRSALRDLHRLMRGNAVDKRYLALLAGRLPQREVFVDAPLRKNLLRGGERVVRVDRDAGKPAQTRFRRVRQLAEFTLVEAKLITGRTHQIRVHAAHMGAPVAGDEKYGDADANRYLRGLALKRLFLHARALNFKPQHRDRPLCIEAPLPPELETLIGTLDKEI
jgi:23S rRNA pseudouridine955/2504/2580 synthase